MKSLIVTPNYERNYSLALGLFRWQNSNLFIYCKKGRVRIQNKQNGYYLSETGYCYKKFSYAWEKFTKSMGWECYIKYLARNRKKKYN